jgi:KaiC/GvpD/RAD55 family RecA-like ATPase
MAGADADRILTGVPGLDQMLYGGVPVTNQVLIAGGPGAGKTLLTFEILYNNAKQGIPCLFITLEEDPADVLKNVKSAFTEFDDIDDLMNKKLISVMSAELPIESVGGDKEVGGSFVKMMSKMEEVVKSMGAKCIGIDSLSLLKLLSTETDALTYRRAILGLISTLRRLGTTSFLTIELNSAERKEIKFSSEFFIFDGIFMMYQSEGNEKRSLNLEVIKMRRSNHSLSFAPYEITPKGFKVFAIEEDEL